MVDLVWCVLGGQSPRRLFLHACHELGIGPEYSLVSHLWSLDPMIDLRQGSSLMIMITYSSYSC
jgi:hypothetical protein